MFRCTNHSLLPNLRYFCSKAAPGAAGNWCENVAFAHKAFVCPENLPELQSAVASASKVRVLGSGHSFSSVCRSEGTLISLAFMRNILDVDILSVSEMRVHVEGGATLGDVVRYLAPRGFALPNVPSLPHITIAGALATATHGSGLQNGAEGGLPSMCSAIEFVTHNGDLISYERNQTENFNKAVVHLGALGVVSRVSLDVVPAFDVDQRVYAGVDLDKLLPRFEEIARSVDSLTIGINFGVDAGLLWMRYFDRADGLGTPRPTDMETTFLGGHLRTDPVPFYESRAYVPTTRFGPWHDVPSFFMNDMQDINMPQLACQSEFFVPIHCASAALQAIREVASRWPGWPASEAWSDLNEHVPVFHCEVRAIAADGLGGMAPFADRDTCSIHFTWGAWDHRARILEMVAEVEAVLKPYHARPHFGKLNLFTAHDIQHAYAGGVVEEFRVLCQAHDPQGKFQNALLRSQVWGDGDVEAEYAK